MSILVCDNDDQLLQMKSGEGEKDDCKQDAYFPSLVHCACRWIYCRVWCIHEVQHSTLYWMV